MKEAEKRKLYREYCYQQGGKADWSEEAPKPPNPRTQNGAILVSLRHDRNHNSLWLESWKLKEDYGILIKLLFQAFSLKESRNLDEKAQQIANEFQHQIGKPFPETASAVKIYLPTAVQGVNRVKADSNKTDPQKTNWLSLWLIAGGLFEFALAERIKIAEGIYDWRVVALEPKDISLEQYREVLKDLRQFNPPGGGHGIARFDAELVLKLCQQLLENHQAKAQGKPQDLFNFWGKPINNFVGSFRGTHFGSKGQVYGVKELFTLGLPAWIKPDNYFDLLDYLSVIQEHLSVIISLSAEAEHSELLAAYRDFIAGTDLRGFFSFQASYADYVVKQLANSQSKPPRLFSVNGLNIMTKKDTDFTTITRDPSFLRVAKAINQATVYVGKIQTKEGVKELDWQRNYGLAQLLTSQSGSKKDFICAITDFLGKYEHENLRLAEHLHRITLEQGLALSEGGKQFNPDRIGYDIELAEKQKTTFFSEPETDLTTKTAKVLQCCSISDLEGFMVTEKKGQTLKRESVIEFGAVVGVPTFVKTQSYFHAKYGIDNPTPYNVQISSGLYATVLNIEAFRIGYNPHNFQYAIDSTERKKRLDALLKSVLYTYLQPNGAKRNTHLPHPDHFEGVLAVTTRRCPAPMISPLQQDYHRQIESLAKTLNRLNGEGTVRLFPFNNMAEFAEQIEALIAAAQPWESENDNAIA